MVHLDNRLAVVLFICTLLAFVVESQLTQVSTHGPRFSSSCLTVASSMCRRPATIAIPSSYCAFHNFCHIWRHANLNSYIVHSSFSLILPAHMLYFMVTSNHSPYTLLNGLSLAIKDHLEPIQASASTTFPRKAFFRLIAFLTVGITYPGLLWFAAISMAS